MSKKEILPIAKWIAALTGNGCGSEYEQAERGYDAYLARAQLDDKVLAEQRAHSFLHAPRFFIVLTQRGKASALQRTMEALQQQTYSNWQLCDDPSETGEGVDFILRLEEGDVLPPHALYDFVFAQEKHPQAALFYADEDAFVNGKRDCPVWKPDYSEVTALSYDLFGRPLAIRRDIYLACSSPTPDAAQAEEYAFALRCLAKAGEATHIPKVLLTRSARPRPMNTGDGCQGVAAYLGEKKREDTVSTGLWQGSFYVAAKLSRKHRTAIIIPNREGMDSLRRALESIEECCPMEEYQIVIADGNSRGERLLRYYDLLEKNKAVRIVSCEKGGFAALCNAGADAARSDGLLFFSRDAEMISPDTIRVLAAQSGRRGVGAAGCKLVDANRRIAFAGGVAGLCGKAGTPYAGMEDLSPSACDARRLTFTETLRTVTLLSGACMYVDTDVFLRAGRFDETFDDPDAQDVMPQGVDAELSLRLMRRGMVCVYTPLVRAILHRPLPAIEEAPERVAMRCQDTLRGLILEGDPYYNPNFTLNRAEPQVKGEI